MGSGSVPTGPSKAEIKAAEEEQERRLRFEDEKRRYLTEVGAYEIMTQTAVDRRNQSLEYREGEAMPPIESLYVPRKFEPTIDFDPALMQEYDWMKAENLGFEGYNSAQNEAAREFNQRYYTALQTNNWMSTEDRRRPMQFFDSSNVRTYQNQDVDGTAIAEGRFRRPSGNMNRQIVDYLNSTYNTNYAYDYGRSR